MDLEQSALFKELSQGKQLAEQLRNTLSSSSNHTRQMLTEQILSSCQKALSLINWVPPGSPVAVSEDSNHQPHTFKKRKTSTKCGDQVKVCSESSLEAPVDDGCSWRKYGQKDILGSKYPRGYYRCTHRPTQGCLATKQVQRSDNDPTIFEVTYRGRHTCKQSYETRAPPTETTRARDESFKEKNKNDHHDVQVIQPCDDEKQKQPEEVLLSFGSDSNVKSEDSVSWEDISFTFPNPKTEPEGMRNGEDIFFKDSTVEINQNTLYESLNSSFMSTGTSDQCNYFSVSTPSSVTNSVPFCGLDFHLAEVEFDSDFPFDDPDLFC